MEYDLILTLIILVFTFVAGIVDSIAGGGGIITIAGYLFCGVPIHYAIGTGRLAAIFGQIVSAITYIKNKQYNKHVIIFSVLGAIVGSFIGAKIALNLSETQLKIVVLISLPISILLFYKTKTRAQFINNLKNKVTVLIFSLVIGLYAGLAGPGTGTILLISYTFIGLSYLEANGNAKIVNATMDIIATILFISAGKTILFLVIPTILVSMLANYIGTKIALSKGVIIIRPMIVLVMILLIIQFIIGIL